jgi:NadR type nicotinamide-nucleotide adenylyltransferase
MFKQGVVTGNEIRKVCVVGPECTGKTELSKSLAQHYQTVWVEEYARPFLNRLTRPYEQHDLLKIAHGQIRMEDEWKIDANRLLICDTNLIVIKVWSEFKYKTCDPEILKLIKERKYDLYLLTYIDIPWLDDPLREHPDRRDELYTIYLDEMKGQSVPYVEIRGDRDTRMKAAVAAIDQHLPAR